MLWVDCIKQVEWKNSVVCYGVLACNEFTRKKTKNKYQLFFPFLRCSLLLFATLLI